MKLRTLEELDSSFALFDNWDDRYRFLIDLGKRLPDMDEHLKTDEHLVRGCTSRVWLIAESGDDDHLHFQADSDAQIVRGLIYLLMSAYQDKPLSQVKTLDIQGVFEGLGLHQHLSPNRRNGFFAMVERIKLLSARVE
jgi:cysteine desulfuration protein SufE